ncbi:MAG: TVP38/TMEM64 family protein [Phycisphaerales bacterium]|nr:TVP38/TMEM64 family protein [Phycisphaerales bacterium]
MDEGPPDHRPDAAATAILWRRLGPAGALGVLWSVAPAVLGSFLLIYLGTVGDWLRARESGLAIYTIAFMVAAGLGILPTYAQAILGGWVFGLSFGLPAALLGFLGGAIIGYAAARTVARTRVEQLIAENPKARAVREALVGRGFWSTMGVVALLRLPPNSPFALTNLVMAAVGVPRVAFAVGTLLGMTPRTAVAVAFAAVAARGGRDIQEFLKEGPGKWALIIGIGVMFGVLALIGHIGKKAAERVVSSRGPAPGQAGQE